MFGTTQLYVYQDSENETRGKKYPEITYEMAQEEIAAKVGINLTDDSSRGKKLKFLRSIYFYYYYLY